MAIRTKQQIEEMIAKLLKLRGVLPEKSFFGDDNHRKIDFQIRILQDDIDEDWLWDNKEDEDLSDEDISEITNAQRWLDCEMEDDELVDPADLTRDEG